MFWMYLNWRFLFHITEYPVLCQACNVVCSKERNQIDEYTHIRLLLSSQFGFELFRVKPIYNRLHRNNARLYGTTFICNIRDGFMANLHFVKVQIVYELIANKLFDFFFIHSLVNFSIDVYNFVAASVKNHRYYKDESSCACKVVVFIARKVSAIYLLPPWLMIHSCTSSGMTYCRFLPSAAGLPFLFDVLVFSIKIRFTVLR